MPLKFLRKKNKVRDFPSNLPEKPVEKRSKPRTFFKRRDRAKGRKKSNDTSFANAFRRIGAVLSWLSHGIRDLGTRATFCRTTKVQEINIVPSEASSLIFESEEPANNMQETDSVSLKSKQDLDFEMPSTTTNTSAVSALNRNTPNVEAAKSTFDLVRSESQTLENQPNSHEDNHPASTNTGYSITRDSESRRHSRLPSNFPMEDERNTTNNRAMGDNTPFSLPSNYPGYELFERKPSVKSDVSRAIGQNSDDGPEILTSRPEAMKRNQEVVSSPSTYYIHERVDGESEVPPEPSFEQQSQNDDVFNEIRNQLREDANAPSDKDTDTTYDIDSEYSSEPDCPPNYRCSERDRNRRQKYGNYLPVEQIVRQTIQIEYMCAVDIIMDEFDAKHQEIQDRNKICGEALSDIVDDAIFIAQERARIPVLGTVPGDNEVLGVIVNMAYLADYRKKLFGRVIRDSYFDTL